MALKLTKVPVEIMLWQVINTPIWVRGYTEGSKRRYYDAYILLDDDRYTIAVGLHSMHDVREAVSAYLKGLFPS